MGDMTREPSMEDILSSIRRVIARDEAPATDTPAPRIATGEDILDLHDEEEKEDAEGPAMLVKDAAEPAEETVEPVEDAVAPVAEEELVSAASADAARQSLEALTAALAPPPATTAAPTSGRTMEDVVVDTLRPMLKDWLDANLPPLVEAMVAKEIRRITGRKF